MRTSDWESGYTLVSVSNGERLEEWNGIKIIRPDPSVLWSGMKGTEWSQAKAHFIRGKESGGSGRPKGGALGKDGDWIYKNGTSLGWLENGITTVKYRIGSHHTRFSDVSFMIKPTSFKHLGIFPEQAVNWDFYYRMILESKRKIRVLNLFAYTGGASICCSAAGAEVTHLDAVKNVCEWAKENEQASFSEKSPGSIRYITDDAVKFAMREVRRGKKYDGIILDPPAFGRGSNGETWKFDEHIYGLLNICTGLLSEQPLFFALNCYVSGASPALSEYLLKETVGKRFPNAYFSADEIGLRVKDSGLILPCGSTCLIEF